MPGVTSGDLLAQAAANMDMAVGSVPGDQAAALRGARDLIAVLARCADDAASPGTDPGSIMAPAWDAAAAGIAGALAQAARYLTWVPGPGPGGAESLGAAAT